MNDVTIENNDPKNERYYDYMLRRTKEEDMIMAKQNATDNAQRSIWVTFNKEGVHMYPGADTDPKLATGDWDDVSFLGIPHRHIFHFRVRIQVFITIATLSLFSSNAGCKDSMTSKVY